MVKSKALNRIPLDGLVESLGIPLNNEMFRWLKCIPWFTYSKYYVFLTLRVCLDASFEIFVKIRKMNFKLAEFKAIDDHFSYLDEVVKELHLPLKLLFLW